MRGLLHGEGAAAEHAARTDNPHAVTAAQAGADPAGSAAAVQNLLAGHTADLDNPHQVQASQIPCLPWDNVSEAVSDINNQLNKSAETQYKWAKSQYQLSQAGTSSSFTLAYDDRASASKTVYYAAEVAMTADHQAVLVDPIILNYTPGTSSNYLSTLRGKYVAGSAAGTPYYVSPTATIRESTASAGSRFYQYLEPSYKVSVVRQSLGYVYSESRNAYPDAGEQDGYYYEYAGEENTPVIPKIVTGTYTGSGTYGASNKNSLTFPFVPKFVAIQCDDANENCFFVHNAGYANSNYGSARQVLDVTWDDTNKIMSWYILNSSTEAARYQLNGSGKVYKYVAIG